MLNVSTRAKSQGTAPENSEQERPIVKDEEAAVDDASGEATRQQRPQPDNTGMQQQQLDILSKMNERMKALNVARLQREKKYSKVEHDNAQLMSLLKEEILTEGDLLDATHQYEANNTGMYHIASYIAGCVYRMGGIASFIGYDVGE